MVAPGHREAAASTRTCGAVRQGQVDCSRFRLATALRPNANAFGKGSACVWSEQSDGCGTAGRNQPSRRSAPLRLSLRRRTSNARAPCCATLDKLRTYLESNERYLIDYGKRYRAGLPIGSAPAESAVNQLGSLCMAKQPQMRWSDEGAHALVQVRPAVLNGQLLARARTVPWYRRPAKNACQFEDFEAQSFPIRRVA